MFDRRRASHEIILPELAQTVILCQLILHQVKFLSQIDLWHFTVTVQNSLCQSSLKYVLWLKVLKSFLEHVSASILLHEVAFATFGACLIFALNFDHSCSLLSQKGLLLLRKIAIEIVPQAD